MAEVIFSDGRYPLEAYGFLHEGMSRSVQEVHGKEAPAGERNHVTGKQICMALKDLAMEKWGLLAPAVLGKWNIHTTLDFGNMVYLLIDHSFMHKTDEDSLEDFRDVYDFNEAFAMIAEFELKE